MGKLKEINRRIADLWKGLEIEKVRNIEKIVIEEWLNGGIQEYNLISSLLIIRENEKNLINSEMLLTKGKFKF